MRTTRDQMLMKMAQAASERATCSRLHVGAVTARDSRVISTGYNGRPAGLPHCEHIIGANGSEPTGCIHTVHAEANAIAFAARVGAPLEGAELFVTHSPCWECAKLIINSGVVRVVYDVSYRKLEGIELMIEAGLSVGRVAW